jgi:hypothetical protein
MRLGFVCVAALALAACIGDKAELGGMDSRMAIPAQTKPCDTGELKVVQPGTYVFPGEALMFAFAVQKGMSLKAMKVSYDVSEAGVPVNISYVGPAEDMRHATKQKLIRAAVDGVKSTRFGWIGQPGFAVGCSYTMDVMISINQGPGKG